MRMRMKAWLILQIAFTDGAARGSDTDSVLQILSDAYDTLQSHFHATLGRQS